MVTAVQKITLSSSRDIPFNKLVLSQSNVRRVKAGVSIEELAEDIARRTLLQGLNVRPVLDAEGAETGMFEIPAGGRRYRALELLVKQKRLAKTAPVPCVVRDPGTDILGEDDSLAENIQRAPLHPLDQFRAFQALREKGRSEEDIAAAFFVGVNVVKQRLRLASVSPTLLDLYAEDGMSLEQLMAFTVTGDHARQEQVWQAISGSWQKEPYQIRRMLTEKTVRASDRRAVFVGLDIYEAAGGVVLRDLFQSDDGGWLEDIALLDGLVAEKLKTEAETIAAEGWKWIEVAIDFPYGHSRGLRALEGVASNLTSEERATIDALTPNTPSSKPSTMAPTNCPMRWTNASARSKRRSPPSTIGRSPMTRPTSPAPASSSASTPKARCRSTAATSGRRTRRPWANRSRTARPIPRGLGRTRSSRTRPWFSAPSSPSADRSPDRRMRTTRT
jgi:ParB family transcriptional regulator, chromosome partitioning protein